MNKTEGTRKIRFELTYMNIFCALLVIFIHCASVLIGETNKSDRAFNLIFAPWRFSSFVVPAFIFLSGVKTFLGGRKINYFKFYKGRITRVILPYMLWVTIFYIYFINHHYFNFSWQGLFHAWYRGDLAGHFYFVIIILQFYILVPLWSFVLRRLNPGIGIAFSILFSMVLGYSLTYIWEIFFPGSAFPYDDIIFTKYLPYWTAGCYIGMNYDKATDAILRNKLFITLIFLSGATLDIHLGYRTYSTVALWMDNVHMLYCAAAVLFFFMLFTWICGRKTKVSWLTKALDAESYNIYLSHCLIVIWLNDFLLAERGITSVISRFIWVVAATYIVSILFWLLWYFIKTSVRIVVKRHREYE